MTDAPGFALVAHPSAAADSSHGSRRPTRQKAKQARDASDPAWGQAARWWAEIAGRTAGLDPSAGAGQQIAAALDRDEARVMGRLRLVAAQATTGVTVWSAAASALELVRERGQPVTMLLRGLGGGSSNATCAALDQALIDEASGAVEVRRRTPQRRGGGLDFDSVAGRFSLDDIFGVDHG